VPVGTQQLRVVINYLLKVGCIVQYVWLPADSTTCVVICSCTEHEKVTGGQIRGRGGDTFLVRREFRVYSIIISRAASLFGQGKV